VPGGGTYVVVVSVTGGVIVPVTLMTFPFESVAVTV
jgi:hypothetical protein